MVSILWFRHGLRLHDNPAFQNAVKNHIPFLPIFIFDGKSAGTSLIGYNRMKFLLESLSDLDNQFRSHGGRLYIFKGDPIAIFSKLHELLEISELSFEQDCEPIWQSRDDAVKNFCDKNSIKWGEFVSHTLWDPRAVIETNGGSPPLTYQIFLYTVSVVGPPPRPVSDVDWSTVRFATFNEVSDLDIFYEVPTPQDLGVFPETSGQQMIHWIGGETRALELWQKRLNVERDAFLQGFYLPNQMRPDLLGPPTSLSPALRFGCLSIRKFYWSVHDLYNEVHGNKLPDHLRITGQLIWREFFYTMSVNNFQYGQMEGNEICLDIPWKTDEQQLKAWKNGQTGFPFIDAVMRQLKLEGWIHHVGRNAVASFLSRGVLWISWEAGVRHFLYYLLDADWSVCAGNWMWISSSAFEQLLDCSACVCPVNFGRRFDPYGEFIKRYVPELSKLPTEYLYEPWKAPLDVQQRCGCIIGKDYPERIVNHVEASFANRQMMESIRDSVMTKHPHCAPSDKEEVCQFMWLPESCMDEVLS